MQFDRLNRREIVTLLGGEAVWPLAARAQQQGWFEIPLAFSRGTALRPPDTPLFTRFDLFKFGIAQHEKVLAQAQFSVDAAR